jgi:hypothetical protein
MAWYLINEAQANFIFLLLFRVLKLSRLNLLASTDCELMGGTLQNNCNNLTGLCCSLGSHNAHDGKPCLLGYNAGQSGESQPTFRRKYRFHLQVRRVHAGFLLALLFDPEDMLRNVG